MKGRGVTLLIAGALLLALCGCGGEKPAPSAGGSASPAPTGTATPAPAPSATAAPSNEPEPTQRPEPPRAPELTVQGEKIPAGWHEGEDYRVLLPLTGMELHEWDGGATFVLPDAEDSYLSVSTPGLPDIETAAAWLRFEYAVESEPESCTFGAGDYVGLRLTQTSDALTQEFILYSFGEKVYLVERAVFAGAGEFAGALLEAAQNSLEFFE